MSVVFAGMVDRWASRRRAGKGGRQVSTDVVLGSAVVGLLVGMTGAGGGALMTPMLILLFSVKPTAAISSDLVAAVLMRPVGAAVHLRRGNVNRRLVAWLALGSVPSALLGAFLLHVLGGGKGAGRHVELALGAALLAGAGAMLVRAQLDRRSRSTREASVHDLVPRPLPTVVVGVVGGLVVGTTSVGAGSLMIVLLLFLYPSIGARQLVGTDLAQAIPLTLSAALGALVLGHVAFPLTAAIVVGSVPAVAVGATLSSRLPDRYVRPVITLVILASGLKYVGVGDRPLLVSAVSAVSAAAVAGALRLRRARVPDAAANCYDPQPTKRS